MGTTIIGIETETIPSGESRNFKHHIQRPFSRIRFVFAGHGDTRMLAAHIGPAQLFADDLPVDLAAFSPRTTMTLDLRYRADVGEYLEIVFENLSGWAQAIRGSAYLVDD